MEQQLKHLIDDSSSILITSHIGPDGDSISSSIFLYQVLKLNHPDKQIHLSMEEPADYLSFVDDYSHIQFDRLENVLASSKPDMLIVLDANSLKRITRHPETAEPFLATIKVAAIDHHEPADKDDWEIYINHKSSSVAQDIFEIFIEKLGYQKPTGYAQTVLLGIYTDTGGFIYENSNYKKTFQVVASLIDDGADLELLVNQLNQISEASLRVVSELITNIGSAGSCTYSFLSDDFIKPFSEDDIQGGTDIFRSNYLRNIEGRTWGFLVYKDLLADGDIYSVSLRALSNSHDVAQIARKLGGGGHKPAAGAKIKAASVNEALKTVLEAIGDDTSS